MLISRFFKVKRRSNGFRADSGDVTVGRGQYYKTLFSDVPTDLADVPKQKSSRQKLPKNFLMFHCETNFFGKFFSDCPPNFSEDPKKKFYSTDPWDQSCKTVFFVKSWYVLSNEKIKGHL